jgi:adenosylhomocysteinase
MQQYEIADIGLWQQGRKKIDWAASHMPLLLAIRSEFEKTKPFSGKRIAISIHLEAKTAFLAQVLRSGGAEVFCTGCNPLSTQDAIAAALAQDGFAVYAIHGADDATYRAHLIKTLSCKPDLVLDDGGDFLALLSGECRDLAVNTVAGTEETTTGVLRLVRMKAAGRLPFPMIAVNNARCKHLFDNRYGTGQSVMDALMRNTNLLIAGKQVVVGGYGWCSRGIALRASGLGAQVIVTEVDAIRALEAAMDGYRVMAMDDAARLGDIFVTSTGCRDILVKRHFMRMKDGALLANAGHFDVEINKADLLDLSVDIDEPRDNITAYHMADGRKLHLLAQGRLVNIAAADGHPVEIMDMSFAVQAKTLSYLATCADKLPLDVLPVPEAIDQEVAHMKVCSMGMGMDALSEAQAAYIGKEG